MRIVIVGASGTIGQAVAKELAERHEIVAVGSKSGDVRLDVTDAGVDPGGAGADRPVRRAGVGRRQGEVRTFGRDDRGRLCDRARRTS